MLMFNMFRTYLPVNMGCMNPSIDFNCRGSLPCQTLRVTSDYIISECFTSLHSTMWHVRSCDLK